MSDQPTGSDMQLIAAIARREGTTRQLSERFGRTPDELRVFVKKHNNLIANFLNSNAAESTEPTPTELAQLWITQKFERLWRYQVICDQLYAEARTSSDPTVLRELRAYLTAAANELGQLLHRGSGDAGTGDSLNVEVQGVDMDTLR
jgi:hypothetical protein